MNQFISKVNNCSPKWSYLFTDIFTLAPLLIFYIYTLSYFVYCSCCPTTSTRINKYILLELFMIHFLSISKSMNCFIPDWRHLLFVTFCIMKVYCAKRMKCLRWASSLTCFQSFNYTVEEPVSSQPISVELREMTSHRANDIPQWAEPREKRMVAVLTLALALKPSTQNKNTTGNQRFRLLTYSGAPQQDGDCSTAEFKGGKTAG